MFGWAVVGLAQIFHPPPLSPSPFAFLPSITSSPLLFSSRRERRSCAASFLNAVGLNWQKGPRHGATLYPPSAPPPFPLSLSPSPSYIYIYNSIKRPVDAPWHCWHLVILTSRCETSLIQREIARGGGRERGPFSRYNNPSMGPYILGTARWWTEPPVYKRGAKAPWN